MPQKEGKSGHEVLSVQEFEVALSRCHDALMRRAFNLTRNSADAKELVQEAIKRGLQGLSRFTKGSNFGAWMMKILFNSFQDSLRKRKGGLFISGPAADFLINNLPVSGGQEVSADIKKIRFLILLLRPEYQEALQLVLDGFSHAEAARQLGIPIRTFTSRVRRAREELQKLIGHEQEEK